MYLDLPILRNIDIRSKYIEYKIVLYIELIIIRVMFSLVLGSEETIIQFNTGDLVNRLNSLQKNLKIRIK